MGTNRERIAVVPAGAFGTAMGIIAARNGHDVALYTPRRDTFKVANEFRQNPHLPGFDLPPDALITTSLAEALDGRDIVVFAAPSHIAKRFGEQIAAVADRGSWSILSLTKGLHVTSSEEVMVFTKMLQFFDPELKTAAESGPNFANVVAEGKEKVRTVIASENSTRFIHKAVFSTDTFLINLDTDEIGVQAAGATKNVYALGVGMCEGAGVSRELLARLVAAGPGEMAEIGLVLGGRRETFDGIAGFDDLQLTCTEGSRNYRAGIRLGKKHVDPQELVKQAIIAEEVVEGVHAAWGVKLLSEKCNLELPVMGTVVDVLYNGLSIDEAVKRILKRAKLIYIGNKNLEL